MSNPMVAEVLGAWLADTAGAEALMRHLVADHTHLDLKEDAKVWGECGGGGRALMRHLVADHTHLDLNGDAKVWGGGDITA